MSNVEESEVAKFSNLASEWWDGESFAILRKMNPLRVQYVLSQLSSDASRGSLLDVGCGGGVFAESMASLGFKVVGIDPSQESIDIAIEHARTRGLDIEYCCADLEQLCSNSSSTYDIITLMEVIEHVPNPQSFLEDACKLLNRGGMLFLSTLNRTLKSMALGIVAAEYVLRWVPVGTHSWKQFVKPSEACSVLHNNGMRVQNISGMHYKILHDEWHLGSDCDVNYILAAKKL
ncbi:MAG: bifunctional 2-polyprenyl-6-hydroxyphenol methylase/3-demethylubiquinol 3-O-methyltransferase UbiG [Anaplasma sp.]